MKTYIIILRKVLLKEKGVRGVGYLVKPLDPYIEPKNIWDLQEKTKKATSLMELDNILTEFEKNVNFYNHNYKVEKID